MNGRDRNGVPDRKLFPGVFWVGLGLLVMGSGPLLAVELVAALGLGRDPDPNPIFFGMLAGITFWPAIGLTIAGLVTALRRW